MCKAISRRPAENMKNMDQRAVTSPVLQGHKITESRKIRKPLMEKRRRARINHSLNELKRMLLDAEPADVKQSGTRPTKLEKADILEMTVRHVQRLQQRNDKDTMEISDGTKFEAGFSECAREVRSQLALNEVHVDDEVRVRLGSHLNTCLEKLRTSSGEPLSGMKGSEDERVTSSSTTLEVAPSSSPSPPPLRPLTVLRGTRGYTLVPTKLPNGDLAFVIPAEIRTEENEVLMKETNKEENAQPVWRPW